MKRTAVGFRIGESGKEWLDKIAAEHAYRDRSTVIRAALALARKHETELIKMIKETHQ